ncbi:MAG: putative Fe-S center protein [Firmicutes bacterium]|nr:putative Fe-S center protein [Bacillota bacterium]
METSDKDQEKKTKKFNRRDFLKFAGGTMAFAAIPTFGNLTAHAQENVQSQVTWSGSHAVMLYDPSKPNVYFTRDLSPEGVQKIYAKVNQGITGKVGIKLHTGEPHGPNLLPIEYIKNLQKKIPNSSIVECNVLYKSPRRETKTHRETIKINGFDFCPVDILDEDGDVMLPMPAVNAFLDKQLDNYSGKVPFEAGIHLHEIAVGKHLLKYDSLLVYTHFKGHTSGGFGGSLKNIGIGLASGKVGKRMIHGEGWSRGKGFLERMVESGDATVEHFKDHIAFINVLKNISVDCDCAGARAAKPTCPDIGIIGSTDILAADQACIDLIYQMPENDRHDIVERIESRFGLHQLEYMEALGMGSREYNLIEI